MATSRDIQARETRQTIIHSVSELLRTTDYNEIRITDIAKAAGISVGTVYLYFKSKGDIVTTLVRERNEILTDPLDCVTDQSVVRQYEAYIDRYVNQILKDGFQFSRGMMLALIEEKVGHQRTDISRQNDFIVQLIERGLSTGELKDNAVSPQQFFEMFIASVNGSLMEWMYCGDDDVLIHGMENTKKLIRLLARNKAGV